MKQIKAVLILSLFILGFSSCVRDEFFDPEEQALIDDGIITEFLKNRSLFTRAEKDETSGIYYIIDADVGGRKPTFGETVIVDYQGFLLTGELFDRSLASDPFDFVLGRGDVIRGWDIGFSLIGKGTTATFFIPSGLAYGTSGFNTIPPNSILQFEVTLLDIR